MAAGLQYVPAGKAIVLGYTTPLWVAIGARAFLGEAITKWRVFGIAMGLGGLAVIFSPQVFDWTDANTLLGCGCVLLGAACWATSIVYVRSHRWLASPFQLLFWQVLIAAVILSIMGLVFEGVPRPEWTPRAAASPALCRRGRHGARLLGHVHGQPQPARHHHRARACSPRRWSGSPAAALMLGEPVEPSLLVATALILGGIALGSTRA